MIIAGAWAVIENDQINVRSISSTRRAAIINFLVTDRCTPVFNDWSDGMIEALWEQMRGTAKVETVTVTR